jgi:arylsulfatase A-like enzyme
MARYDSEIAFTDHHIGRLLGYLEERGMLENTVVAFVSDHGEEFRDHGRYGHTVTLYEELIRVPLMIFVPDLAANRVPAVVASLDLGPTLLALLGLHPPDEFRGEVIRIEDGAFAAPIDRVVFSETRRMQHLRGVRQGEWKLVRDLRRQTDELFHLPSDPLERTDLSESEVERRRELRGRLREHYQTPTKRIDERRLSEKTKKLLEKLGYLE